jgi:hypothetical protein
LNNRLKPYFGTGTPPRSSSLRSPSPTPSVKERIRHEIVTADKNTRIEAIISSVNGWAKFLNKPTVNRQQVDEFIAKDVNSLQKQPS